jgi:hypothetical protein
MEPVCIPLQNLSRTRTDEVWLLKTPFRHQATVTSEITAMVGAEYVSDLMRQHHCVSLWMARVETDEGKSAA